MPPRLGAVGGVVVVEPEGGVCVAEPEGVLVGEGLIVAVLVLVDEGVFDALELGVLVGVVFVVMVNCSGSRKSSYYDSKIGDCYRRSLYKERSLMTLEAERVVYVNGRGGTG